MEVVALVVHHGFFRGWPEPSVAVVAGGHRRLLGTHRHLFLRLRTRALIAHLRDDVTLVVDQLPDRMTAHHAVEDSVTDSTENDVLVRCQELLRRPTARTVIVQGNLRLVILLPQPTHGCGTKIAIQDCF